MCGFDSRWPLLPSFRGLSCGDKMKYVNLIVNIGSLDEDECEVIEAEISELLERHSMKLHSTSSLPKQGYKEEELQFYPNDM